MWIRTFYHSVAAALAGLTFAASGAVADVSPFKTPSGNIECTIGESIDGPPDLRCVIFERAGAPAAPRPETCADGWGHIFFLFASGPTRMDCGHPGSPSTAPGVEVANYGVAADWGGIQCQSAATGFECRNADGHGFFLSRARQSLF